MKSILAASLLLTAALATPAIASASTPTADSASPAAAVRVSTGVTAPELLVPLKLNVPPSMNWEPLPGDGQVALTLLIDENGNAHGAQITHSMNTFWDARVLEAVQSAKFRPASIDAKSVPMTLNLIVKIAR